VAQLKEMQFDLTAQHRISVEILDEIQNDEIQKKGHVTARVQCILDSIQLVALTISNLQRIKVVLSEAEEINSSEVMHFDTAVRDSVCDLQIRVIQCLRRLQSAMFATSTVDAKEFDVSMMTTFSVMY